MGTWEYCTLKLESWDDVLSTLTDLGADGWELVNTTAITTKRPATSSQDPSNPLYSLKMPDRVDYDQRMVFKRPAPESTGLTKVRGHTGGY